MILLQTGTHSVPMMTTDDKYKLVVIVRSSDTFCFCGKFFRRASRCRCYKRSLVKSTLVMKIWFNILEKSQTSNKGVEILLEVSRSDCEDLKVSSVSRTFHTFNHRCYAPRSHIFKSQPTWHAGYKGGFLTFGMSRTLSVSVSGGASAKQGSFYSKTGHVGHTMR